MIGLTVCRWMMLLLTLLAGTSFAQHYPHTVVDLAGRSVTLKKAPQRIFLQDGNDLLTLALLEREDPFKRLAGWDNVLGSSDPSMWALLRQRWPHAAEIPNIPFDANGSVDKEALLMTRPDLIVAQLAARAGIENTALGEILERLEIPLVYVDLETDPLRNAVASVELLGQVLNQVARAEAYGQFYRQRLARLQQATKETGSAPRVFLEVRAGQSGLDHCCFSQGRVGWGLMIEGVGGKNLAADYLTGNTGDISLETLIRLKPDIYLMTGSQRHRSGSSTIPFGYNTSTTEANDALKRLMERPGFSAITRSEESCVYGLYHQFYKSVFNIVGLEYLGQIIHPEELSDLKPAQTYSTIIEHFTNMPSVPSVMKASRSFLVDGGCRGSS
ncbi:ABC transporter substrate-binding protein [Pseudomonas syringae]|uniref:ABC transporter substrate-binding protein n=1 Tax=Pseudomonas syringae TaxID=317 RepID=UPI003F764624